MADSLSPAAREALLEVIDNQMRDGEPPETQKTLKRLLREGIPRDEALKMITFVLLVELDAMVRTNSPFDEARYTAGLKALPESIAKAQQEDDDDEED